MVADGKENLHPNSTHLHEPNAGTKVKQSILGNTINKANTTRPLLFSEILFNNNNNNGTFFSTTCTSPVPNPSNLR